MDMQEEIISKLQKLLRLSKADASQHESDLALEKAIALATQHGIDIASIDLDQQPLPQEKIENEVVYEGKEILHSDYVNSLLTHFFNVKAITWGNGSKIAFVGKTSDIVFAKYLRSYLMEEFQRRWNMDRKEVCAQGGFRPDQLTRKSYMYGLFCGLSRKLREAKEATVKESFVKIAAEKPTEVVHVQQKYELMIVSEHERLTAAMNNFYPHLRKARASGRTNAKAVARRVGHQSGQRINIPGSPLNDRSNTLNR